METMEGQITKECDKNVRTVIVCYYEHSGGGSVGVRYVGTHMNANTHIKVYIPNMYNL